MPQSSPPIRQYTLNNLPLIMRPAEDRRLSWSEYNVDSSLLSCKWPVNELATSRLSPLNKFNLVLVHCVNFSASHPDLNVFQVITVGSLSGYVSFETLLQSTASSSSSSSPSSTVTAPATAANPRELIATICYSTGTTGKPKGCVHTHSNFISAVHVYQCVCISVYITHN